MIVKNLFLTTIFICLFSIAFGQKSKNKPDESIHLIDIASKNLVKLNLFALPLKTISLQYERAIAKKISIGAGLRLMPKSKLPFSSLLKNIAEDEESEKTIDGVRLGNFAITPEIRFYLGKETFKGFYIAPHVRFANYNITLPVNADVEQPDGSTTTETFPLDGRLNTITGGILFGAQWKVANKLYLDWWILGPNYGASNGTLTITRNFTPEEQESLRQELQDIDLEIAKTSSTVDANKAQLNIKGPWAGVRVGLCIGYRF